MSNTLYAKQSTYTTIQGDLWDLISLSVYGDEHAMNWIQDANFDQRFTDMFPAGVVLQIPAAVVVQNNLKTRASVPPINQLLPWRNPN